MSGPGGAEGGGRARHPARHIVPFGGLRPPPPGCTHPIVDFVLDLTGKERARVCCIATATGDAAETLVGFYNRFPPERAERRHLGLFHRTVVDVESFLCDQDVIWVGGGNTASMLAVWRAHGVDRALRAAWEAGVVLTGGSAGSLCWFECGTTDSFDIHQLAPLHDGLGFLAGSHCPHYDGEPERRPLYQRLVAEGFPGGWAVDDDAALHFVGTEVAEVVAARPGARAWRVERGPDGGVVETPHEGRLLEARPAGRREPAHPGPSSNGP